MEMKVVLEIPIDDLRHVIALLRSHLSAKPKKIKRSVIDSKNCLVTFIVKDFNTPAEIEELIDILSYNKLLHNVVLIEEGDSL